MTAFALILGALAFAAAPAHAASACDGMVLSDGVVRLTAPLGGGGKLSPDEMACLDRIGAELVERGGVRSLTVAARVPDAWRVDGTGERLAAIAGARMGSAGIPTTRITMVVPPVPPGGQPGVVISFTESRASRPVGLVAGATGVVQAGPTLGQLAPAQVGTRLAPGGVVRTGPGAAATLGLADGSRVRLAADTEVLLGRLTVGGDMKRKVELDVRSGEITAEVETNAGAFEVRTPSGTAGVRGTVFRVAVAGAESSRLETLEGKVNLGNEAADVDVDGGFGSRATPAQAPEAPRALPAAPKARKPLDGRFGGSALAWRPVRGAPGYRVELARDAEFTLEVRTLRGASGTRVSPDLIAGTWFWRVAAVDQDGFTGSWSRVHAFDVRD